MATILPSDSKIVLVLNILLESKRISLSEYTSFIEMAQTGNFDLIRIDENAKDLNETELEMMKMLKLYRKPTSVVTSSKTLSNESSTSPLGNFLRDKKKRHHSEHELKLSLANDDIQTICESTEYN
jgi:chlorite dismutase